MAEKLMAGNYVDGGQTDEQIYAAGCLKAFRIDGEAILCRNFGNGHINDTYLVVDETARSYILQRINKNVFRDPIGVMQNIVAVINHLQQTAKTVRNVLELVPTQSGDMWHMDGCGDVWRLYTFISDSVCYQLPKSMEIFQKSGAAFGAFQKSMSDFPAHMLIETIPNFHNTPVRYDAFNAALNKDAYDRARIAKYEVEFAIERENYAGTLMKGNMDGIIPLRVTHNDTKLNNVLFDRRTSDYLCVIDLDTVMPGFSLTDFGDSIRFGASTALEDEKDLSKVSFSIGMFEAYAEGFLSECGSSLTDGEIWHLCDGAIIITLETGLRFLTDYISGDTYFKTAYDGHNLDRCRTQFKLVADMEAAKGKMMRIIENIMHR